MLVFIADLKQAMLQDEIHSMLLPIYVVATAHKALCKFCDDGI